MQARFRQNEDMARLFAIFGNPLVESTSWSLCHLKCEILVLHRNEGNCNGFAQRLSTTAPIVHESDGIMKCLERPGRELQVPFRMSWEAQSTEYQLDDDETHRSHMRLRSDLCPAPRWRCRPGICEERPSTRHKASLA